MPEDRDFVEEMLRLGSSEAGIAKVIKKVKPIAPDYGTAWPHNCCALFQSAVLNLAGISFGFEPSAGRFAYKLGGELNSRRWTHIPVGQQQPGDIGVCFDDDPRIPGADHVYLVIKRIDDNEMVIADNQRAYPHHRCADGTNVGEGRKTPTEYFLRAPNYIPKAMAGARPEAVVLHTTIEAAAATEEARAVAPAGAQQHILDYAQSADFLRFDWSHGQHRMPRGYIKGMALVYARVYCKLLSFAPEAIAMAVADQQNSKSDALSWYASKYKKLGLSNSENGVATLRNLFNMLIGLGVHESSGRYFCGRDTNAHFVQSHSAEAGLFQASYGARTANSNMQLVCDLYKDRTDFLDVFKEGVAAPDADNLKNWSTPDEKPAKAAAGIAWQKHTKESPAFAAEYAALCLRYSRGEFGTIRDEVVEISLECDAFLRGVEKVISDHGISGV